MLTDFGLALGVGGRFSIGVGWGCDCELTAAVECSAPQEREGMLAVVGSDMGAASSCPYACVLCCWGVGSGCCIELGTVIVVDVVGAGGAMESANCCACVGSFGVEEKTPNVGGNV